MSLFSLALEPVEVERLSEGSVNRVLSDETRALGVQRVADLDGAVDVENGVLTTWAIGGGGDGEGITVGVFVAIDGSGQVAARLRLSQLSLEVVDSVLGSRDLTIKLEISTVINSRNSEREASWDVDSHGDLTVLSVLNNADSWSRLSAKFTERNSDGLAIGAQQVECRAGRAARAVNTKGCDVKERRSYNSLAGIVSRFCWKNGSAIDRPYDLRCSSHAGDESDEGCDERLHCLKVE